VVEQPGRAESRLGTRGPRRHRQRHRSGAQGVSGAGRDLVERWNGSSPWS